MPSKIIAIGSQFGRLTITGTPVSRKGKRCRGIPCQCSCGSPALIPREKWGATQSCGCLQRESIGQVAKSRATHGMTKTSEYRAWQTMKDRCENPEQQAYSDYGARGITVCPEFQDFPVFYAHIGPKPSPKHSLDRIDNSKGYEPGNVKWSTSKEQNLNRRCSVFVEYRGETRSIYDWETILGFNRCVLYARIKSYGWSVERAFTTPQCDPHGILRSSY